MQQVRIKSKCSTALLNMSLNKKMSSQFVEQELGISAASAACH